MSRSGNQRPPNADGNGTRERVNSASALHVDLLLRADPLSLASDVHGRARDRLRGLQEARAIDSFSVDLWGTTDATREERDPGDTSPWVEKFDKLEEWASDRGVSLRPGFQRREVRSAVAAGPREKLLPPLACLVVYNEGSLEAVFPYTDGDDVVTVADGLDRLEADAALVEAGGGRQ